MKKKKTRKKKGSVFRRKAMIVAILSVAVFAGYLYAKEKSAAAVISNGVYIENINLGGKNSSEAEALLKEKYGQAVNQKSLTIKVDNKTFELDSSKLQAHYNIHETVDEAFGKEKSESILKKLITRGQDERKDLKLTFTYDSKAVGDLIDRIEKETNKNAENAKLSIINGEVKITPEIKGVKLQKEKLKQAITAQINGEISKEEIIITAPLDITMPEITSVKLSAANTRISSFSTNFSSSIPNRANNIELATKAINGTVLMPGESFSFNNTVGKRTAERGYKEAGVIIGDKLESGLGGGICQVSSTLYNAILAANLKPEERKNHTLPLGYVPKGLDATVDWGNIDFRFKNTLSKPIYIEGYTKDKNVNFNIYSNKDLAKRTYQLVSEIYETIQPKVKYVDDPDLKEGETHVVNPGSIGYKVKVSRKTFENGKLINTELISNDYYLPADKEVVRGTKKL